MPEIRNPLQSPIKFVIYLAAVVGGAMNSNIHPTTVLARAKDIADGAESRTPDQAGGVPGWLTEVFGGRHDLLHGETMETGGHVTKDEVREAMQGLRRALEDSETRVFEKLREVATLRKELDALKASLGGELPDPSQAIVEPAQHKRGR